MKRRIIFIFTILILLAAIFSLLKTLHKTYLAGQRIKTSEQEVQILLEREKELKKELIQKDSLEFVERQARDKLALVKPGETIVVVGQTPSQNTTENQTSSSLANLPNPKKWWVLFFGSESTQAHPNLPAGEAGL